jgi:hypothetical protein
VDFRRGDVADLALYRSDTLIRPIEAARIPAVVNADAYRSAGKPVYSGGIAVYHPREFARRADGRFPQLVAVLVDRSGRRVRVPLSEAALRAVQRDLASYQR